MSCAWSSAATSVPVVVHDTTSCSTSPDAVEHFSSLSWPRSRFAGPTSSVSGVNPVRRTRIVADAVRARVALIGADPLDDEDTRSSKALLVLISVLILPIALLWGVLYLAFGSPVGFVPLVYFVVLLGALGVFSRRRDFALLLRVNLLDILFAPTLSMIPLGGFLDSGGVGLWGILAPLGALVFSDVRAAAKWYAAYVVIFLGSGIAGEVLGGITPAPPVWFTSTMLALNVVVGGTIVFTLLALFAQQRRDAVRRFGASRPSPRTCSSTSCRVRSPSSSRRRRSRSPISSAQPRSSSPTWSTSRRGRSVARRPRLSASSTDSSRTSTPLPRGTDSRRSRPSAIATWWPLACRHHGPIMPRPWR